MHKTTIRIAFLIVLAVILVSSDLPAGDNDYLDTGDFALISAGSMALGGLGLWAINFDTSKIPIVDTRLPGELTIQKFLGGEYYRGKTNFLDNTAGSAATPIAGALILTYANLTWPHGSAGKDAAQDLFLYSAGLIATKGITGMAKGIIARPRPYMYYDQEYPVDDLAEFRRSRLSFFSGHTSSAFFSMTFLNKRIRGILRHELSGSEFDNWSWVPPAVFYTWASFVGWTRIHSYKHYISDVIFGALAGWLLGELFYSFGDDHESNGGSSQSNKMLFQIRFQF